MLSCSHQSKSINKSLARVERQPKERKRRILPHSHSQSHSQMPQCGNVRTGFEAGSSMYRAIKFNFISFFVCFESVFDIEFKKRSWGQANLNATPCKVGVDCRPFSILQTCVWIWWDRFVKSVDFWSICYAITCNNLIQINDRQKIVPQSKARVHWLPHFYFGALHFLEQLGKG